MINLNKIFTKTSEVLKQLSEINRKDWSLDEMK